ncbi:DUF4118 domain-containing protein [Actinospica durhamensis]|uniref:DUF4118 domain-containing protein n=2 Tax=Actinospica durhamensis TaxID=1508375 RepID=A0A941IML5_9ACTN|nr:DUF4118 domain-containing protein [Actinospica durhamensis]
MICTALIPARTSLPNTDAALVLVAFIVAVAAFGNRAAGYLATLGTALWFDFFLTVPYERLTITHRTDVQTTTLLVLVGAGVTELAVAARRRARVVALDETLLAVVESTAALMARGESTDAVIDQVRVQLTSILALRACGFEPGAAQVRGPRLEPEGTLRWGAADWKVEEHGFPRDRIALPARYCGGVYGHFLLTPTPGTAPGLHARRTAVVLADLAAASLAGERTQPRR